MLTLSRATARQFHQILRKAKLLKPLSSMGPAFVRFIGHTTGLTLQSMNSNISVSLLIPEAAPPESFAVPVQFLADCGQSSDGNIGLVQREKKILAEWTDKDVPHERVYEPVDLADLPPIPALPTDWSENSSQLLAALNHAMQSTDPESTRYALGCVQLDGSKGQLAATDGDHALVQRGYQFPWSDQVLIPASKIFQSDPFQQDGVVQIGKTEQHVVLKAGFWTIAFTIQTAGHFPDLERIIPAESAVRTSLRLDATDIRFLTERLDQLPHDDDRHQPVTVDLNGSIAIRARRSPETPATELVLRRSVRDGDEVRLQTNRRFLKRALELGFTEIGFTSSESPAVCRDTHREFVWAVLDPQSAIPASEDVHRVDSFCQPATRNRVARHLASAASTQPTSQSSHPAGTNLSSPTAATPRKSAPVRKTAMSKNAKSVPSEVELITQLLDLRKQLRMIEQGMITIARHLRARRKQQRLMKSTLESLKQLQTLGI